MDTTNEPASDSGASPAYRETVVWVGCGNAKRDPDDPADLEAAAIGPDESWGASGHRDGPAWMARDLYTSTYFQLKREFAEAVSECHHGKTDEERWAVLSAEHRLLHPRELLEPYDTPIEDLGGDPSNPAHRVENQYGLLRPDGEEVITERDLWARRVANEAVRWFEQYQPQGESAVPTEKPIHLIILTGQKYLDVLRDRGVFEYLTSTLADHPNEGASPPLEITFLFEEIDAGGMREQMSWLSDAVDQLSESTNGRNQGSLPNGIEL